MAIEIVDFPMKNGGSFHSYVTVYQRVRCKISNFPLFWPSGRKRHLGGVNIVQRLAHLFRMRLLAVNFNRSGDLKTLMFSWWILMVWSPAKKYIYICIIYIYIYIYLFMYLFIYLFIHYLFIYLFIIYLFIYLFYIHRKKQLYKLRGIDGSWTWFKKTCATSKTSMCLGVKSMPSTCVQKTAIRWMVCRGVNPIILPKIAIGAF